MATLRCKGRIHGELGVDDILEIKCSSKTCGARSGTVVLHYFDIATGELLSTKKFQDADKLFNNTSKEKTA